MELPEPPRNAPGGVGTAVTDNVLGMRAADPTHPPRLLCKFSELKHGVKWSDWTPWHKEVELLTKIDILQEVAPLLAERHHRKELNVRVLLLKQLLEGVTVREMLASVTTPIEQVQLLILPHTNEPVDDKEYRVGEHLGPKKASQYFMLQPDVARAYEAVASKKIVAISGPRGSGKTTLLRYLSESLENDKYVYVRLQIPHCIDSPGQFWNLAGKMMQRSLARLSGKTAAMNDVLLRSIDTFANFMEVLRICSSQTDVVIAVDNCDRILETVSTISPALTAVKENVKTLLNMVRRPRSATRVHVICVGPEASLDFQTFIQKEVMPDNIIRMQNFSLADVEALVQLHCDSLALTMDSHGFEIAKEVHNLTDGHPSLVCSYLAKLLQLSGPEYPLLKVEHWPVLHNEFASVCQPLSVSIATTISQLGEHAYNILEIALLSGNVIVEKGTANETIAHALAAEGLLHEMECKWPEKRKFSLPCALMQRCMYEHFAARLQEVIHEPLPITEGGSIDLKELINKIVDVLHKRWQRGTYSAKTSKFPVSSGVEVPNEALYHMEIFCILRCWIWSSKVVRVDPEVRVRKPDGKQGYIDLLLSFLTTIRQVLEFAASVSPSSAQEHYTRTLTYVKQIGAGSGACVTFTCVPSHLINGVVVRELGWPTGQQYRDEVLAFHIVHDEDWSVFHIHQLEKAEDGSTNISTISNMGTASSEDEIE